MADDPRDELIAQLLAQTQAQAHQIEQLLRRVDELLELVRARKRTRRRKRTAKKPAATSSEHEPEPEPEPEPDPPGADGPASTTESPDRDDRVPLDRRPTPPARPRRAKPEGSTGNAVARHPIPDHFPVVEEVAPRPEACPSCGSTDLPVIDEVVHERADLVPAYMRKVVTRRKVCSCGRCGARVASAPLAGPFPRSKVTSRFIAWLVFQKYGLHLPLDRIKHELAWMGFELEDGTLNRYLDKGVELLGLVDGVHWQDLLRGDVMQIDATTLRYVLEGVGAENGILDQFFGDGQVVFQFSQTKHGEDLAAKLARFEGTIVADAEHRMNELFEREGVTEAGCNAHGRRKFLEAENAHPLAEEGGRFLGLIFDKEAEARKSGLIGDELFRWRQTHIRPLFASFRRWIDIVEPHTVESCPLGKACRYYQRHWSALTAFVNDVRLPPDNNAVERNFQHVAIGRTAWRFTGSVEAGHRSAVLMGILATCRHQGVDGLSYLTWAIERLGVRRRVDGNTAAETTPSAFKKALEEGERHASVVVRHAA
jgi:transposase